MQSDSFDVAVIGAGPAGIACASTLAQGGRRVLLLDQGRNPGGQIWRHREGGDLPSHARQWIARLEKSGATVVPAATVVAVDGRFRLVVSHMSGGRGQHFFARALVLATGARELLLPFPGWTLPGVIGAGAAQALLKDGADFGGKKVVVAGSGPLLLPVAAALAKAGAEVSHVLEQARAGQLARFAMSQLSNPSRLMQAAKYRWLFRRSSYSTGSWVESASGDGHVEQVVAQIGGARRRIECDLLCTGYGLIPSTELARVLGLAIQDGAVVVDALRRTSAEHILCAGETTGVAGEESAIAGGVAAAQTILGREIPRGIAAQLQRGQRDGRRLQAAFRLREEVLSLADAGTVICRCEDVRFGQLPGDAELRELKLTTRAGMGACQGRICGAALAAMGRKGEFSARSPIFSAPLRVFLDAGTGAGVETGADPDGSAD